MINLSKRMLPPIETLIKLYVDDKKSLGEICRMYGLSQNSRGNLSKMLKNEGVKIRRDAGKNHHNWKGGRTIKGDGYYGIWNPKHEKADSLGYVYEHTLVYEKEYGKLPKDNEVIHHIDMDKTNNRIENLYLCDNKEHITLHRSIDKLIKPLLDMDIIEFINGEYKIKGK